MLSDTVRNRVRMAQVLVGGLISGVVVITGAMAFVVQQRAAGGGGGGSGTGAAGPGGGLAPASANSMLITLGVLTVALLAMAYLVLPLIRRKVASFAWRNAPAEIDSAERLAPVWMNGAFVSAAMAEAVGLLGAVMYLLTERPEALGAPAAAVAAMVLTFPTAGRFRSFVRGVTGQPDMEM